jgi:hypothetical protein
MCVQEWNGEISTMEAIVHTLPAIETMLRMGLTPITDNPDALAELGFERAYPQMRTGYDSTIWERSIDVGRRNRDGLRMLARERAFLCNVRGDRGGQR